MQREPPPFVWALPDEKNILACEYLVCVVYGSQCSMRCRALHSGTLTPYESIHNVTHLQQRGPPDTPFAGGEYHGVLLFPSEYPFKPPGIKVRVIQKVKWMCRLTI